LFCPNCKLEYRAGFTRCADCDVDLVAALPKATEAREVGVQDLRSPSILRRGVSVSDATVIRDSLNTAGIRFNTRRASAEIIADGTPSYEFWVNAEDRLNAQSVLDAALEAAGTSDLPDSAEAVGRSDASPDPSGDEAPASEVEEDDPESDLDDLAEEDDELGELDDEELTAEVWSGSVGGLAGMLKMCLREVGIASRGTKNGSRERLLVAEADLSRSREIIREVIEATPPE